MPHGFFGFWGHRPDVLDFYSSEEVLFFFGLEAPGFLDSASLFKDKPLQLG